MKKRLVLAMAATMAITSCAVPVLADDAAAEGGKIGISMPTQSLERWNRDGSYLEEQFKAAGYDVELTYSDNETDRQVNDIQNLISDGVNLLELQLSMVKHLIQLWMKQQMQESRLSLMTV